MVKHSQPATLLPFPVANVPFQNILCSFYILFFSPQYMWHLALEDTGRICGKQNAPQHPCAQPNPWNPWTWYATQQKRPCRGDYLGGPNLITRTLADSGVPGPCARTGASGTKDSQQRNTLQYKNLKEFDSASEPGSRFSWLRAQQGAKQRHQPTAGIHGVGMARPSAPLTRGRINSSLSPEPRRHLEGDCTTRGLQAGHLRGTTTSFLTQLSTAPTFAPSPEAPPPPRPPRARHHSPHTCPVATRSCGQAPGRVRIRRPEDAPHARSRRRPPRPPTPPRPSNPSPSDHDALPSPLEAGTHRGVFGVTRERGPQRAGFTCASSFPPGGRSGHRATPRPYRGCAQRRAPEIPPPTLPDFRASVAALGGGGPATWGSLPLGARSRSSPALTEVGARW